MAKSSYNPRRSAQFEDVLTQEEEDVVEALKDYTDDPEDGVDIQDFVPTSVLYRIYCDYWARCSTDPDSPDRLSKRQFGAALRRVFPEIGDPTPNEEGNTNPYRVKRRYHGKRVWGYTNMRGPESIRTPNTDGRPPKDVDDG